MRIFNVELAVPQKSGVKKCDGTAHATAYLLDCDGQSGRKKRPVIIICPGGGYGHLSRREGEPVAMQYLSMGYHVFVLSYSLSPDIFPASLMELAMLVSYIRNRSDEFCADTEKIIVSGFSAGGHLACSLGVFWSKRFLFESLGLTADQIRPNGMILAYPVITSGQFCHEGSIKNLLGENYGSSEMRSLVSLENQVDEYTPKTFLWHTSTDQSVPAENSMLLAQALLRNNVSLEMHIYPTGAHGLSLANEETADGKKHHIEPQCQSWISLAKIWIENLNRF